MFEKLLLQPEIVAVFDAISFRQFYFSIYYFLNFFNCTFLVATCNIGTHHCFALHIFVVYGIGAAGAYDICDVMQRNSPVV